MLVGMHTRNPTLSIIVELVRITKRFSYAVNTRLSASSFSRASVSALFDILKLSLTYSDTDAAA
jgi:hypothetical protein